MDLKELAQLIIKAEKFEDIDERREEIIELIPQAGAMVGYDLKNRFYAEDLWTHSVKTALNIPKDIEDDMIYVAALLHDIAKPLCQGPHKKGKDKDMHYYDHDKLGGEMVKNEIIPMLKEKGNELKAVEEYALEYYVKAHHAEPGLSFRKFIRKQMMYSTMFQIENMIKLKIADASSQEMYQETKDRINMGKFLLRHLEHVAGTMLTAQGFFFG